MLYVDGIRAFAMGYHIFYESAEFVSLPGAGEREGKIGSLYTGILDSFLSKLHSGRNDRDIHDRGEYNPSMEFPDFLLHTFILHKHPFFTTFLKNFTLICR